MQPFETPVNAPAPEVLAFIAREADTWGATFDRQEGGGRLELPVVAGLRRGWLRGQVSVEAQEDGSKIVFNVDESIYRVQSSLVAVLALAAVGALTFLVGPFVPWLRPAVPLGFMLSLGAWFVVANLRNSGPEEFFEAVADQAADGQD